jgi:hypothetical protein
MTLMLSAGGAGTALATPAAPAAPAATLTLSSAFPKVSGDVLVLYKDTANSYDIAHLSGELSGMSGNPQVDLMGYWFPFTAAPVVLASATPTLAGGAASFSFDRTPSNATKWFVKVLASSTAGAPTVATSNTEEAFVSVATTVTPATAPACSRPTCHMSFTETTFYPPSVASQEEAKYLYSYLGYTLSATKEPPPPTDIQRYGYIVKKSVNTSTGEVTDALSFSFTVNNDGYNFVWTTCDKDTVTVDGMGLPGTHDCGDTTIPFPIPNNGYLG